MPALIYLHGFLSSPQSFKAQQTQAWLEANRSDISYHCPFLSSYPHQARQCLDELVADMAGQQLGLIGSSLGGFWATYLAERHNLRAVLVNPAVRPQDRFSEFVGQPLKNYHSDDIYCLGPRDLEELVDADTPELHHPANYWVLLQTGDDTLDYRQAAERYKHSRLLIEPGGSHTFDGYENWLPQIVDFLFSCGSHPAHHPDHDLK